MRDEIKHGNKLLVWFCRRPLLSADHKIASFQNGKEYIFDGKTYCEEHTDWLQDRHNEFNRDLEAE